MKPNTTHLSQSGPPNAAPIKYVVADMPLLPG
jgi:hypothetical protein